MKRIVIQPAVKPDLTLPYPYFIDDKALVGRQDFWKGEPLRLIGFSVKPIAGTCEVLFEDFWKAPYVCIGKYPVFEDKNGNWTTSRLCIESFTTEKIERPGI